MSSIVRYCALRELEQIHDQSPCQESFECLFAISPPDRREVGRGPPLRTSGISPGGVSLMNSAAAESFWAFEAMLVQDCSVLEVVMRGPER